MSVDDSRTPEHSGTAGEAGYGNLAGKTAVVLGASNPCGRATSRMLAGRGVNLALGGRSRDELEALQEEIEASDGRALVVGTHLAKRHHPAHLVEAALKEYGSLDILLFMARATAPPLGSPDLDAWERSIDVNLKGFMYCLAASMPALREGKGGCVAVLNVEDPAGRPDPFLRAGQDAVRTILGEVADKFSKEIRAIEVRIDARFLENPKRCAEVMFHVLNCFPDSNTGFLTYHI